MDDEDVRNGVARVFIAGEPLMGRWQVKITDHRSKPDVKELLGHKSVETTMIYTHVLRTMSNRPKSPLDTL